MIHPFRKKTPYTMTDTGIPEWRIVLLHDSMNSFSKALLAFLLTREAKVFKNIFISSLFISDGKMQMAVFVWQNIPWSFQHVFNSLIPRYRLRLSSHFNSLKYSNKNSGNPFSTAIFSPSHRYLPHCASKIRGCATVSLSTGGSATPVQI